MPKHQRFIPPAPPRFFPPVPAQRLNHNHIDYKKILFMIFLAVLAIYLGYRTFGTLLLSLFRNEINPLPQEANLPVGVENQVLRPLELNGDFQQHQNIEQQFQEFVLAQQPPHGELIYGRLHVQQRFEGNEIAPRAQPELAGFWQQRADVIQRAGAGGALNNFQLDQRFGGRLQDGNVEDHVRNIMNPNIQRQPRP